MSSSTPVAPYESLSPSSTRADVASVLRTIIDAPPFTYDDSSRRELVHILLADLKTATTSGGKGRLTTTDAAQGLLAVKTLCRNPVGSEVLATSANLSTLLFISTTLRDAGNVEAADEALRCVANALLLIESGRTTWVQKDVGGGDLCIELLEKSTSPEQIFLASRILFLCTASSNTSASYIISLVEGSASGSTSSPSTSRGSIVDVIASRLDLLRNSLLIGTKMSKEAMVDLLKFAFNLLAHYPKLVDEAEPQDLKGKSKATEKNKSPEQRKVMGDYWSTRLNGLLPALLRTFNSLPATFPSPIAPPLTHVIHSLIVIPASSPSLHPIWFPPRPAHRSASTSSTPDSPSSDSPTSKEKPGAFDRAMNMLQAGRRSISSRSSSPNPAGSASISAPSSPPPAHDTLLRAYDLLDLSMAHFLPDVIDPDEASVRERVVRETGAAGVEGGTLDQLLSPLVVLLTRLALAHEPCKVRLREWILPSDLDRVSPLEQRADLLGRCLRVMACVHHARLKDAVGEMLFAVCDSDSAMLSAQVGYGNAAGFLFNKGILSAPPASSSTSSAPPLTTAGGVPINPITGVAQVQTQAPQMTDEEKEREAEKLFVLFERLEKTGALPPGQNPIRNAVQSGKLAMAPSSVDEDDDDDN